MNFSLSVGEIVGISVSVSLLAIILIIVIIYYARKRRRNMLYYDNGLVDGSLTRTGRSTRPAKKQHRNKPPRHPPTPLQTQATYVQSYLKNENLANLYRPGMTIDQAMLAVNFDPRHEERKVKTYLNVQNRPYLYSPTMTRDQAEHAVEREKNYWRGAHITGRVIRPILNTHSEHIPDEIHNIIEKHLTTPSVSARSLPNTRWEERRPPRVPFMREQKMRV